MNFKIPRIRVPLIYWGRGWRPNENLASDSIFCFVSNTALRPCWQYSWWKLLAFICYCFVICKLWWRWWGCLWGGHWDGEFWVQALYFRLGCQPPTIPSPLSLLLQPVPFIAKRTQRGQKIHACRLKGQFSSVTHRMISIKYDILKQFSWNVLFPCIAVSLTTWLVVCFFCVCVFKWRLKQCCTPQDHMMIGQLCRIAIIIIMYQHTCSVYWQQYQKRELERVKLNLPWTDIEPEQTSCFINPSSLSSSSSPSSSSSCGFQPGFFDQQELLASVLSDRQLSEWELPQEHTDHQQKKNQICTKKSTKYVYQEKYQICTKWSSKRHMSNHGNWSNKDVKWLKSFFLSLFSCLCVVDCYAACGCMMLGRPSTGAIMRLGNSQAAIPWKWNLTWRN